MLIEREYEVIIDRITKYFSFVEWQKVCTFILIIIVPLKCVCAVLARPHVCVCGRVS